jgi:hypothetical protein
MLRATYGAMYSTDFDKDDPEHLKRSATAYLHADGKLKVPGIFKAVLQKVNAQFKCGYFW